MSTASISCEIICVTPMMPSRSTSLMRWRCKVIFFASIRIYRGERDSLFRCLFIHHRSGEYLNECEIQFPFLHFKIRHSNDKHRDRWTSSERKKKKENNALSNTCWSSVRCSIGMRKWHELRVNLLDNLRVFVFMFLYCFSFDYVFFIIIIINQQ